MAQEPPEGSAGEMMVYGLIQHADEIGKTARATQRALSEQIQQLAQLQKWTVQAAVNLQKQADAAIQNIAAERAQLQGTRKMLEQYIAQAIYDAVREQSGDIKRQTEQALASPLKDIERAAGYVRQCIKEASWLLIGIVLAGGMVLGLLIGYFPLRRGQNTMQEQLNRIEQYLAAQQAQPVPAAAPDAPGHKGKAK